MMGWPIREMSLPADAAVYAGWPVEVLDFCAGARFLPGYPSKINSLLALMVPQQIHALNLSGTCPWRAGQREIRSASCPAIVRAASSCRLGLNADQASSNRLPQIVRLRACQDHPTRATTTSANLGRGDAKFAKFGHVPWARQ